MTSLDDRIVSALRVHHDRLADLVATLSDDQLVGPSGATEWRICDVLSHLGSGAEIMVKPLRAAIVALAGNLQRAAEMGQAGRRRALLEFLEQRCGDRTEILYRSALTEA